ncbi:hypothetical protein NBRC116494_19790 [Aurantivibrio plasticivorans]
MTARKSLSTRFHPLFVAVLLASGSTSAANECRLKYEFSNGSSNPQRTLSLSTGETRNINQVDTLRVENIGRQSLEVIFQGGRPLLIPTNQSSPHRGLHTPPKKLVSVKCIDSALDSATSPQALTTDWTRQGRSAIDIARVLKSQYTLNAEQTTKLLMSSRHGIGDIAGALQRVYNASTQSIASTLKAEGYPASDIILACNQALRASPQTSAKIAKALFRGSASQTAIWLKSANYPLAQIPSALQSIESNPEKIVQAIKTAYNPNAMQLVSVLKRANVAIDTTNCTTSRCTNSASLLKRVGYPLNETLKALKSEFNISFQASYEICKNIYRADEQTIRQALQYSGYSLQDINNVLSR